ncbi:MAG: hypothetical protein K2X29_14645 [Candidatus Obscuribacterales bacterium]|nr:hypothetical protein [Candidatus Obscuribacterales bacterium]
MTDNTFSGTGETPENQPPQFVLDSSTNQKEDGNQAIAQMTAIRNPSGTSYLPRVTVGNCEAASKLFDPAAPLTAIVPGMNRKDTTTRVTNEWTIPVEDDRTRGVAVLDLRDPTLRYMLGSGLGPPTKVTDFNKRVVEIDLNDGSYGASSVEVDTFTTPSSRHLPGLLQLATKTKHRQVLNSSSIDLEHSSMAIQKMGKYRCPPIT